MKKSAMQQLIYEMKILYPTDNNGYVNAIRLKCYKMLELEKKQIIDSYDNGKINKANSEKYKAVSPILFLFRPSKIQIASNFSISWLFFIIM